LNFLRTESLSKLGNFHVPNNLRAPVGFIEKLGRLHEAACFLPIAEGSQKAISGQLIDTAKHA
jgi:hypothetical protein